MSRFGSRRNPATLRRFSGAVASSGAVLPTTDLLVALFADQGVTDDGAGEVTAWADQDSTSGPHDFVQATAADRPTLQSGGGIDGGDTIAFGAQSTGGKGHLEYSGTISASATPLTGYFVLNPTSAAGTQGLFASANQHIWMAALSGNVQFYDYDAAAYRVIAASTTGAQALTWRIGAPTGEVWRGRSSLGTGAFGSDKALSGTPVYLGTNVVATAPLNGDVEAVLLYAAAHDATQRAAVWDYLADRYPSAGL